jgi:hypothetical protein
VTEAAEHEDVSKKGASGLKESPLRTSPEIADLAGALAAAQGEMEMAARDATNPHFNKTYADLASVWRACRPQLAKNGLAVLQVITRGTLITRLVHKSGQWIEGDIRIEVDGDRGRSQIQAFGSSLTYLRRYALAATVGVAPDDDDDGETAAAQEQPRGEKRPQQQQRKPDAEKKAPPAKVDPSVFEKKYGEAKSDDELRAIARDIKGAGFDEPTLKKLREARATAEERIRVANSPPIEAPASEAQPAPVEGELLEPGSLG